MSCKILIITFLLGLVGLNASDCSAAVAGFANGAKKSSVSAGELSTTDLDGNRDQNIKFGPHGFPEIPLP